MGDKIDFMVVAAHTDDPEFGVAGSVAKWTSQGKSVVYVICTNGDKGTADTSLKPGDLARLREKEQRAAAGVLGVKDVVFLGYPDQGLEDTADFRKEIVRQIRIYQPDTVVTSDPYRRYLWHRDHRMAGLVTLDAVYPYARDHLAYPDLFAQGYQPHKVKVVLTFGTEDPNYTIDITDTFDIKLAALRCHESQVGEDFEGIKEWLKDMAVRAAKGKKYRLGESFHRSAISM